MILRWGRGGLGRGYGGGVEGGIRKRKIVSDFSGFKIGVIFFKVY